ncbi:bifunctional diguanylate cyclase/phosphodiesterase [Salinisphaera sp. LB1]|uniref:putative bifunctional diguanylate cyclase/phosphodiesterase n=1 Tax=Salinisphaera sp. LB1 TaxID=2183911 RepID=UPI000D7055D6|nr:EAL domain-containing protein [Salinisphaera sp. LB1]AWN15822.1 diguanylate cyclase/phosphodiesterase (GGDEF & EAL domains) with PAS/PAC sensor(s) [Salinisphaera sp. LB1]
MWLDHVESSDAPQARIACALSSPGNAKLLRRLLTGRYQLTEAFDERLQDDDHSRFDIVLVDPLSLEYLRDRLRRYRERCSPVVLPVLLLVTGSQTPASWIRQELGHTVDDVLRIPATEIELTARVENMLRLRSLSLLQSATGRERDNVVRALRTLNTCDEILVRAREEEGLLARICQAIVATEGYRLAWIGFALDGPDRQLAIQASAGPARGYLDGVRVHWRSGVLASALQSRQTQVVTDITEDPERMLSSVRAREFNLRSVIVLPLPLHGGTLGCLVIYSEHVGHFDREPQQLLERLARNLCFGLRALHVYQESKRQAAEIRTLAYADSLTELPNRLSFLNHLRDRVTRWQEAGIAGAVLFIDLDSFKVVNDALGHQAGDQVLRWVGQRLRRLVRGSDVVARHGGDEFVVALSDVSRGRVRESDSVATKQAFQIKVQRIAERILQHLREPIRLGEHEHRQGASIGISLFPDHGDDADTLLERADTAMYEAKNGACGHICQFHGEILERRQQRLTLEGRLYQAIKSDQLTLHYQPIFRLDTLEITGVEALVRWPQPDGSLLSPAAFLPLAEETGMIVPLGEWVVATAARQLCAWRAAGHSLQMMVNLSVRQLHAAGEISGLADLVRPHVDPSAIEFEVTESALMPDPSTTEANLAALHAWGFRFAIDDFGTGYSSLSRIKDLPFQTLKIDRSFVSGSEHSGKGEAITRSIIQLARNLSLRTVGEGIETEQQCHFLREWGCEYGQGYWFSRPLPADDMARLLAAKVGRSV